jgi:trimeric autotransporter adhesin
MPIVGHKAKTAAPLGVLLLFAFGVGCDWFVSPSLRSLTLTPSTSTLAVAGDTEQLTATGTYNDGTTRNVTGTSGTTWSSSDPAVLSVSRGLVKALSVTSSSTSVTITATNVSSAGAVSNTAAICVGTLCTNTSSAVSVTCTSCISGNTVSLANGTTLMFTAANANGGDLTTEATWSATPSTIISIPPSTVTSPIMGTLEGGTGFANVTATVNGTSGSLVLKVVQ